MFDTKMFDSHRKLEYFHYFYAHFIYFIIVSSAFLLILPKSCLVPTSNNAFHTNSLSTQSVHL